MMSSSPKSAAERLVETVAALCLGAAAALATFELVPLVGGALAVAAMAGGVMAVAAGFALLVATDVPWFATRTFDPAEFPGDVLLLDRPIAAVGPKSRVVRLFGSESGELVDAGRVARLDASAALHAALAEIRQSLR